MAKLPICAKLLAKRYVRERWVEQVGTLDEPCAPDDAGAREILRNPDGPAAADTISALYGALEKAYGLIRVGGVTYSEMCNARVEIGKALAQARGGK